ncbi:MAG: hypothetical protein J3Q66DRAFT_434363 [Benniella sp.]|nr:MAG: hypothetical protein J3Q66DRAFT_434363 [Benniella sp.]
MESHPNSDSESDPDLESQPQSPGQDKNVIEATMHPDVRHIHSTHRQSHVSEPSHAISAAIGRDHRHKQPEHDLDMDLGQGLYGLSALAAASQQMPRREPFPQRPSSIVHDDSNASESEGSLALEGIDSARQWPSMLDEPRSRKPTKASGHMLEISTQREDAHYSPRQQRDDCGLEAVATMAVPNLSIPRTTRVKDCITKDSVPRKWICRQVPVKTLGGEMIMPIWFSEEDMLLNEPVAPIELDNDRMDMDLMNAHSHPEQQQQHLAADDLLQAHSARHKRKMKLKDMALRESRDPQDLIDLPAPMDNKRRRHHDPHLKELKTKYLSRDRSEVKKLKVHNETKTEWMYKAPQERPESFGSTRDSTPTTPVDTMPESNMSSPSAVGPRPRPFVCNIEDCGKRFVDALQLERHIERHGPKELECDLDRCRKLFSSLMLLRRHQSMVHKRRSQKWETPVSSKPRVGRSRRKEPRIVASGDVMDPSELERQPRGSIEVDQSADDGDNDDDYYDDDENQRVSSSSIKKGKESVYPSASKPVKGPKSLKESKLPKSHTPKKLAPRLEDQVGSSSDTILIAGKEEDHAPLKAQVGSDDSSRTPSQSGSRPRPFHCTYDDCKKVFIDQIQLDRHLERHGPKELECGIDGCRKRFSAQMLLRRHQSMVHKRRSAAVPVHASTGMRYHKAALAAVAAGPLTPSTRPPNSQESSALTPVSTSSRGPQPPSPTPSSRREGEEPAHNSSDA